MGVETQCDIRMFGQREIREAKEHARAGGQALHVWRCPGGWPGAPACFRKAAERGEPWAHLFDADPVRLVETAHRLGVRIVRLHGDGSPYHVDLCGRPLEKGMGLCGADAPPETLRQLPLFATGA